MSNTKSYFQELVEMIEDEEMEEEESAVISGDLKETTEVSTEAQLVADLTRNARGCSGDKPEVDLESIIVLIRQVAKSKLSKVTITLPGGMSWDNSERYFTSLKPLLEGKGFRCYETESEYGDVELCIDWSHLVKNSR